MSASSREVSSKPEDFTTTVSQVTQAVSSFSHLWPLPRYRIRLMSKQSEISAEDFNRFLTWLDSDHEQAGRKYEDLRQHLIVILTCRGCHIPEELADETINRVMHRLPQMIETYEGHPAAYLCTVAHHLFLEYAAKRSTVITWPPDYDLPDLSSEAESEREDECLEKCLGKLTPNNRRLVLAYYQEEKRAKIDHRKKIAEQMGVAVNALRIRVHRVRQELQLCLDQCLST